MVTLDNYYYIADLIKDKLGADEAFDALVQAIGFSDGWYYLEFLFWMCEADIEEVD